MARDLINAMPSWAMLLAVTGVIAFNLVLAITLDYPFSGDVAVSNAPYFDGVLNFQ